MDTAGKERGTNWGGSSAASIPSYGNGELVGSGWHRVPPSARDDLEGSVGHEQERGLGGRAYMHTYG